MSSRRLQNATLYRRIHDSHPDALQCLEQVLEDYGDDAWEIPLKSHVYTVIDAVTECSLNQTRSRLLARLEQAYPKGHRMWDTTELKCAKGDLEMVVIYERNLTRPLSPCLLRQAVLEASSQSSHSDKTMDVFQGVFVRLPPEHREEAVLDAWQYAVFMSSHTYMEKILALHPIDVNARMVGDLSKTSVRNPQGQYVVQSLASTWKSAWDSDHLYKHIFRLLDRHGLDWDETKPGWDNFSEDQLQTVRKWNREMRLNELDERLTQPTVQKKGPRF